MSPVKKISNPAGLTFEILENGSVRQLYAGSVRISLKPSTLFSDAGTNIYLRKRSDNLSFIPLTGPQSGSRFQVAEGEYRSMGSWAGLEYKCRLELSEHSTSWQWTVEVMNRSGEPVDLDLVYVQDVGLKSLNDGLVNEYYVSQYLERIILDDRKHGSVICCRQNMREPAGNPWLMLASKLGAASGCTDGMQFYGKTCRVTGIPEGLQADGLGGNCAGESPVVALQERPFRLGPDEKHTVAFAGIFLENHPQATSSDDLGRLSDMFGEFPEKKPDFNPDHFTAVTGNLFTRAPFLPVDDLSEADLDLLFPGERRHCEEVDGRLLSFFTGKSRHVVMREKEELTDRPHAHIMQAAAGFVPDERVMSVTATACGVFSSHLSQGNTNFNVLLSICTTQFNTIRESGQRMFVNIDGTWYLLGVPTAFEMGLNGCRWIYKHGNHVLQIRTWTSPENPVVTTDFRVVGGEPVNLLVTHDFDPLNGWKVIDGENSSEFLAVPRSGSMITTRFPKARFRIKVNPSAETVKPAAIETLFPESTRNESLFILDAGRTSEFCLSFIGEVNGPAEFSEVKSADFQWASDVQGATSYWKKLSLSLELNGHDQNTAAIREILPWFGMNAITHFLTPYGLEQFSGAAWGTRDVSQGPVDLLLATGKYEEAKQVLRIIFSNQNPDGGWPQWWMFDSYPEIRAGDSHGDIFYWVLIALANYIKITGDLTVLDDKVPYYQSDIANSEQKSKISEHVSRLVRMITNSFIPGTALVPFGGGDWNDSLQPVSKELAGRMISSWTVEMNFQAFAQYVSVYAMTGELEQARELEQICRRIRDDFNRHLIRDGIVAGYGLVGDDGSISVMLHPSDSTTGVHYSLLPMERGILSEIFTPEQVKRHQELIEKYLKGPDGARLMDRPLKYRGGLQKIFQRAESSTFFGREIGLMYVHEHIRYAESLALTGQADAFVKALRQAIPVGYRDIVPCAGLRQSNCYYSSSDVIFRTRYEADELYDQIAAGNLTLQGGWRVYSSGPGIYLSIILTRLLGLRVEFGNVIIDPVIPHSMDGLTASMDFLGYPVKFIYSSESGTFGPVSVRINSKPVDFTRGMNPYRKGGALIPIDRFRSELNSQSNQFEIGL